MSQLAPISARQGNRARQPSERAKVLLVEDTRMFTVALSHQIESAVGADVYTCSTLAEMQAALSAPNHGFSIIVADINLQDSPYSGVLDLVAGSGLPTIVFTGNFEMDSRALPKGANVVEFILKDSPHVFDDVILSVERLLRNDELRVLVVSDGPEMRHMALNLLRERRYLISEASSGEEALQRLNDMPDIGLVIVDHKLGNGTGETLVRTLRRDYNTERLRIVGSAPAGSFKSTASTFLRAGADDFLTQPFSEDEFHHRIAGNADTLAHFKRLQAIASRDFLTDMYNRRHFFERGPVLVRRSIERGEPLSAAVMDIDHFKKFNDTYGHETGDLVLKAVARKIREIVGDDFHLSARLGGEEFALLIRNMNLEEATVFCDSLREEVANYQIVAEEETLSVTISIGLAEIAELETFDNYLHAADQYLYMAKSSGRNCVFSDYSIEKMFAHRRR